jgi:hypothetical protein
MLDTVLHRYAPYLTLPHLELLTRLLRQSLERKADELVEVGRGGGFQALDLK